MIIGDVLAGRYRVEKKIGQGGFASVFQGFDTKLERQVAVKVLSNIYDNESFRQRFFRESQTLARLNHPNVLTVYDFGEHKGHEFLVMELVNGPSLESLIYKAELTISQVVSIALQICRAMEYAHGRGIIHRDLSLKNIMLDEEDADKARVKILDFGLAKLLFSGSQTTGNTMMGTPAYLAPEQVLNNKADTRVDIWAFGVGFYKILTGQLPFYGEHPAALMYSIVNDVDVEFSDHIPDELRRILLRCLSKDPEERPASFSELIEELEQIRILLDSETSGGSTVLTHVSELADRSSKRNPYLNRLMIKNSSDFFGREREVKKIYSRLDALQPQSISVVGDRRIGKSSLLNYVYTKTNRKKYMQNHSSTIFVYLDFQNMINIDVSKFINFLFTVFSFETGDVTKYTKRPMTLDQLKSVIAELNNEGKRIVILMDEFELITRNEKFEEDFFSFLRSLANSFKVAYVTSSRDELQQMCHNKEISDSPFFNIFSNLSLRPFSLDEAMELIVSPSRLEGVPFESFAERIIEVAGLFPFFLQIACSSVFEHLADDSVTEPDWPSVISTFVEEAQPHYSFIWDRFDGMEKENIARIVSGKTVGTKYQYVSDNLLRRGYLVEDGSGIRLCSSTFEEFIKTKQVTAKTGTSRLSTFLGRFHRPKF